MQEAEEDDENDRWQCKKCNTSVDSISKLNYNV
jgi:hypothetical protein